MEDFNKEYKYEKAKKHVLCLRKFYTNLSLYIIVISILAILNYQTNEFRYMWFLWPAFGWGIGLFFHALKTFNLNPFFGRDWEERKIKEFMGDNEQRNRWE